MTVEIPLPNFADPLVLWSISLVCSYVAAIVRMRYFVPYPQHADAVAIRGLVILAAPFTLPGLALVKAAYWSLYGLGYVVGGAPPGLKLAEELARAMRDGQCGAGMTGAAAALGCGADPMAGMGYAGCGAASRTDDKSATSSVPGSVASRVKPSDIFGRATGS